MMVSRLIHYRSLRIRLGRSPGDLDPEAKRVEESRGHPMTSDKIAMDYHHLPSILWQNLRTSVAISKTRRASRHIRTVRFWHVWVFQLAAGGCFTPSLPSLLTLCEEEINRVKKETEAYKAAMICIWRV